MKKVFWVLMMGFLSPGPLRAQSALPPADVTAVNPAPAKTSSGSPPISVSSQGLLFSTSDGSDTLRVHGYLQADDRLFSSNTKGGELDTFLFRRIRPLFEGTLFHSFDYRFMPDFGQYNPQIQEAYIEWKTLSLARVRVGKFKEPIGLEALESDRDLKFPERSMASDLVPLRYMGAQLGGSFVADSITYQIGYFNGSNDGANGNFQWAHANEMAGRVFFRPLAKTGVVALKQFGVGLAGSSGSQRGTIAGLKTVAQTTFFKYSSSTVANGQHSRISPQAYYYGGPFGFLGEYVISSQDVLNKSHSTHVNNEAWQVAGSVVVTGEKNSYGEIRPRHGFEPARGLRHLGAVELVARYSQVQVDHGAFPLFANPTTAAQKAWERGIGVNWYLNRFVKLTTDYEHTNFRMALSTIRPLHSEDVLMSRIQLAF